jgi:peptidyl-prolyl cis-trans isomerase SurA
MTLNFNGLISNLIILALTALAPQARAEVLDGVYATVNDEMISIGDIERTQKLLRKRAMFEDLLFPDDATIERALKDKNFLVDRIIGEKLLDSEAKKLGINVTDERINKDIQSKGGEAHLNGLLQKEGFSIKDYREFLKKSMARKEVVGYYVSSKIKISDDDIMDYYATSSKGTQSGQGFEFNLSHIIFPFHSATEKENAFGRAQAALKSLQLGQTFTSLHSKYNPKEKDDVFGVFKSGEMLPTIETAVGNMRAGDTSQIVETPLGYHIFKLNSKKVVNNPDFDRQRQQILNLLFAKNYKEQLDYWLNQRRKSAVVKVIGEKK